MKFFKIFFLVSLSSVLLFCGASTKKPKLSNEKNPQYQYEKAVIALKYGFPDQALDYLGQALSLDPSHYQSYSLLGLIRLEKGDFAKAVEALEKCLEIKPDLPEALNRLGTAYQGMGRKDKAEETFRKVLALDGNAYAGFHLAKILLEEKNVEEALNFIDLSIKKDSRQAGSYNLKGVILNQMERYPEAIASFESALKLNSNDVTTKVNLGIALLNSKQYEKSKRVFEEVLPLLQDPALKKKICEYLQWIETSGKST